MPTLETTAKRGYPLPVASNDVSYDLDTLRLALGKVDLDVDALLTALSGKAAKVHLHAIGDVNGLSSALSDKASFNHNHRLGDLANVDAGVNAAPAGSVMYASAQGIWVVGNPATILGSHEHAINNIQGLQDVLNSKLTTTSLPGALVASALKATPDNGDSLLMVDSAASNAQKRLLWSVLKANLLSYFSGLFTSRTNNLSDLPNASTARLNLGIRQAVDLPGGNADTCFADGDYLTTSTWIGSPINGQSGSNQGYLRVRRWGSDAYGVQEFTSVNSTFLKLERRRDNGVWEEWRRMPTALPPTTTVSTAAPSGGVNGDTWLQV